TPRASCASSTRPDGAQMPIVAGSGTARGRRSVRLDATSASAVASMELLEGDQVAVGILHHEPARAPVGFLGLAHHVLALGDASEARVDVVDVEMDLRAIGMLLVALRDHHADAAAAEARPAV